MYARAVRAGLQACSLSHTPQRAQMGTVYILIEYQHPEDRNQAWFPKLVVIFGLSVAVLSVLMFPMVGSSKAVGCLHFHCFAHAASHELADGAKVRPHERRTWPTKRLAASTSPPVAAPTPCQCTSCGCPSSSPTWSWCSPSFPSPCSFTKLTVTCELCLCVEAERCWWMRVQHQPLVRASL